MTDSTTHYPSKNVLKQTFKTTKVKKKSLLWLLEELKYMH